MYHGCVHCVITKRSGVRLVVEGIERRKAKDDVSKTNFDYFLRVESAQNIPL